MNDRIASQKWRKTQSGYSVLEILIAIVLLGGGVLLALKTINLTKKYNMRAQNLSLATMYANTEVEYIKLIGTNDPSGSSYGFDYLVTTYLTTPTSPLYTPAAAMTQVDNCTYTMTNTISAPNTINVTKASFTQTVQLQVYSNPYVCGAASFLTATTSIMMLEVVVTTQWTDESNVTQSVTLNTVMNRAQFLEG